MERDSFIFYNSFRSALKDVPKEIKYEVYDAIIEYGITNQTPTELSVYANMAFALILPQLEANQRRYENGKKGGRPTKEKTEIKPKRNLNETKAKPNKNYNVNKNVNYNDNKKDNVNEKENNKSEASSQDRENRLNSFEEFWSRYDYKKEKPKAIACWLKLKEADIVQISKIVDDYVKSTPDKKYRMHPTTYLNPKNRRWEDEIVKPAAKFTAGEKTYKNEDHYSEADDKKWQEEIKKNGYDASTW